MSVILDSFGNLIDTVSGKGVGVRREAGMSDESYIQAGIKQMQYAVSGWADRVVSGTANKYDVSDGDTRLEQYKQYLQGGQSPIPSQIQQVFPQAQQLVSKPVQGQEGISSNKLESYIVLGVMFLTLSSILRLFRG